MPVPSSGIQCPRAVTSSHIILTPGRPVMFPGSYFMVGAMQAATTTKTVKVFAMTINTRKTEEAQYSLGCYTDQKAGQYNGQGVYCGPNTACEVFFYFYYPTIFMSMQL